MTPQLRDVGLTHTGNTSRPGNSLGSQVIFGEFLPYGAFFCIQYSIDTRPLTFPDLGSRNTGGSGSARLTSRYHRSTTCSLIPRNTALEQRLAPLPQSLIQGNRLVGYPPTFHPPFSDFTNELKPRGETETGTLIIHTLMLLSLFQFPPTCNVRSPGKRPAE